MFNIRKAKNEDVKNIHYVINNNYEFKDFNDGENYQECNHRYFACDGHHCPNVTKKYEHEDR